MLKKRSAAVILCTLAVSGPATGCGGEAAPAPAPTSQASPPSAPTAAEPRGRQVVGTSVQGRPLRVLTVGHGARKVLFVGGIHGDEAEGAYTTEQLPAEFAAAGLAAEVTLSILEDANPDGRAAATRGNANGVDINRNFPATNFDASNPAAGGEPLSQPESRAVVETIERTRPALVIVMHSWAERQFINFDGPAGQAAEQFSASSGMPVAESKSFAATPGSLGSYAGRDRGIALITVELRKGSDPRDDWNRIRGALIDAIRGR